MDVAGRAKGSVAIMSALKGTSGDGLTIMAFPAVIAMGAVQFGIINGKLHGVMLATTPSGRCVIVQCTPRLTSKRSSVRKAGMPHAKSTTSIAFSTSAFASPTVLPFS